MIKRSCGILAEIFTTGRMVILRKANFLWLMLILSLAVFMFSGCGGSADSSSSDSDSENTELPNNLPDTYNTEAVLQGTWADIDQEMTVNAVYSDSGDISLNLDLVTASMTFSDTQLTSTKGTATVSIHETWRTSLDSSLLEDTEIIPIEFNNQLASMLKSGADNWKCEMFDKYKNVLNIEVLAKDIIRVTSRKIALINSGTFSGTLIQYDTTLTFRKAAQ